MVIITIVLRLLSAIYIYFDGKKRGENTVLIFLWAVGAALLPVVGIPLYFMLGRKAKLPAKQDDGIIDVEAIVMEVVVKCSSCGKDIAENLPSCPYCNNTVERG